VRSGRLLIGFLDIRILTSLALLGEQSFHSVDSIAQALGVSRSTILSYLRQSLGMKIFHLRWISHELTTRLQQIRMEICRELLPILKAHEKNKIQRFVNGGESWFTLEFHHFTKWSVSRDDVPQKVKQQIGTQKFMLTVIWGIDGFHVADWMTEQHN
jgi:biotin operon repressor